MQPDLRSRYLALAATLIILVLASLPLYHSYAATLRDQLMISIVRHDSIAWTSLFEQEADSLEQLVRGGQLSSQDGTILKAAGSIAGIESVYLFDARGKYAVNYNFGSTATDQQHGNLPDTILTAMLVGDTVVTLDHKPAQNTQTRSLVAAYIPVYQVNKLIAVVELDIETTATTAAIDQTFSSLSLKISLTILIVLVFLIVLHSVRNSELRKARDVLVKLDRFDKLTDTYNRAELTSHVESCVVQARLDDKKVVFACIDIDRFKAINEQFGIEAGDRLLQEFAARIRANMRDSDVLARLSNNAFAVVMDQIKSDADVTSILDRIRGALHKPFKMDHHDLKLTVCIGIAVAPEHAVETVWLISCAETALHHAKLAGRGNLRVFKPSMEKRARDGLVLEAELRTAIRDDLLSVHYQPQVDIDTGRVVGCEALVRWQHERLGTISPARFVALAEECGLVKDLSARVIRRACNDATLWPIPITVAVNLSPTELTSGDLACRITEILRDSKLSADRLELEITEGMVMKKSEETMACLQDLRKIGVGIAIDDFGTGYSSLSYLASFSFTKLKIDRAFVVASSQYKNMTSIIKAIVSIGTALKVTVIVEGVETKSQLDRMQRAGCCLVQGYYFSKPLTHTELVEYLSRQETEPIAIHG